MAAGRLWLVCLEIVQRDGWRGPFQMVARGRDVDDVVSRCRRRLVQLRRTTTLFHKPCEVFLDGAIELRGTFRTPVLANYTIMRAVAAGQIVTIGASVPEQRTRACDVYAPESHAPNGERPLVAFGRKRTKV